MIASLVLFTLSVPLVSAIVVFLLGRRAEQVHAFAVVSSALSFVAATTLVALVGGAGEGPSVVWDAPWIPALNIRFHMAIDAFSAWMIWVAAFSVLLGVLAAVRDLVARGDGPALVAGHHALFFVIQAALCGFFLARDLVLLFLCYETVLVPMYLLILVWGGKERVKASLKFLLFTLFGSLPMLVAIAAVSITAWQTQGVLVFDIDVLRDLPRDAAVARWIFAGFALAFLVKVPLWPLHTWLPDAHTEAPTAGSIVLAGSLLKMGGYGLMVVAVPLFPQAAREAAPWLLTLSLAGILLGGLASLAQTDAKRLIAYSSVSHMGLVVLAVFSFSRDAWLGAALQMIAHGVSTGALFYLVGALYRRRHDRSLESFGGLASLSPGLAGWSAVLVFSSAALPGTAGFAAEFLALFGTFSRLPLVAVLALPVVVVSAAYMLKFFRAVALGVPTIDFKRTWTGAHPEEILAVAGSALLLVGAGLMPWAAVLRSLRPAIDALVTR